MRVSCTQAQATKLAGARRYQSFKLSEDNPPVRQRIRTVTDRSHLQVRPLRPGPTCTGPGRARGPSPEGAGTPKDRDVDSELRKQQTTRACPFLRAGATDGGNLWLGSRQGAYCPTKWEVEASRCSIVGERAHSGARGSAIVRYSSSFAGNTASVGGRAVQVSLHKHEPQARSMPRSVDSLVVSGKATARPGRLFCRTNAAAALGQ
jgi:hypothetical protein